MKTILLLLTLLLVISCDKDPLKNEITYEKLSGTWVNNNSTWDTIVFISDSILTQTWLSGDKEFYRYTLRKDSITFDHQGPLKILILPYTVYIDLKDKKLTLIRNHDDGHYTTTDFYSKL